MAGQNPDLNEDWKFVTNNTRIVVLPDPRLSCLINEAEALEDDRSSTSDHVQGEGLDELEYEYEPGIALQQLQFASPEHRTRTSPTPLSSRASLVGQPPFGPQARCPHCGVDYESDLQLAAELGKTLLERNKELEGNLRDHQSVIEDQSQEIEYLTKQTATLREVNDSRVKIYEQLEVSIADLEKTNQKLMEENQTDKIKIKSLCDNIEKLENRCEELQKLLDDARKSLEKSEKLQKRRRRKSSQNRSADEENPEVLSGSSDTESERVSATTSSQESGYSSRYSDSEMSSPDREDKSLEEAVLHSQMATLKVDKLEIEERLQEMEKVVQNLQLENRKLQTLLATNSSDCIDYKSVDDEVLDIYDVRRGKLCRKCLNVVDATPANLIGTAFQMMGETANQELEKVFAKWEKDELRLRSRNVWLDLCLLAVCFFALAISLSSSAVAYSCRIL